MLTESTLKADGAMSRTIIDAGDYFIGIVAAGQTMRILDLEGNQAADTLFYSAEDPSERYSAMDTIREQGNVYLTTGSVLRSNENTPMLEIVAEESVDLIVPTFDTELLAYAAAATQFEAKGCRVMVSAPDVIEVARDKWLTAKRLAEAGVPVPKTATPEEVLAGQKVKLLVKDDGDHYFQLDRGRFPLGRLVDRVRERIGSASPPAEDAARASGED